MNRIVSQTFSTDKYNSLSPQAKREMMLFHLLSALSIKKQLKGEQFILITDSLGKELCKNFPYDKIITPLDNYPHERPLSMSSYKMYALEVFKEKTFVHFDNDVYLFKQIPEFTDVLIQSSEGGFTQAFWHNKLKGEQWELPNYCDEVEDNYNPGIFGFTADSKVRQEYIDTFNKYYQKNLKRIKKLPILEREFYLKNICDINLILEETVLYHLCKKNKVEVVEMLPDKFKGHYNVWGDLIEGRYLGLDWRLISEVSHERWEKDKYYHAVGEKNFKPLNFQKALIYLYLNNKKQIDKYLTIDYGYK